MIRHLVHRLPGGKGLAVVFVAAALALGGLSMSSIHAPSASAQCFGYYCGTYPYSNYSSYGYPYGYNAFNYGSYYPYSSYNNYSGYYPYSNYYNNYSYGYPYNAYSSYYPYNSYSSYGTYPYSTSYGSYPYGYSSSYNPYYTSTYTAPTTVYSTTTYPASNTVAAIPGATYQTGGSYCSVGSGQVWVPAGASPAAYGCTGSAS